MIEPIIYTTDNGQSYQIEFNKTKDHVKFEHYKTVKFLSYSDLISLRDKINKIIINYSYENKTQCKNMIDLT